MPQKAADNLIDKRNAMLPVMLPVKSYKQENSDTFTLVMDSAAAPSGSFRFLPGQFNMLYVYGVGEVPISISGDPADSKLLTHTTRAVGTVTRALWQLRPGDQLAVRGPYGTPWPVEAALGKDVIFIAGGIGLAPLRPAIYQVLKNRNKFGRMLLLYGARTPDDLLYKKELQQWGARFDFDVFVTVDHAIGAWKGNVGVVTNLITRAPFDRRNAVAMICGPEVMMRFCVSELQNRGLSNEEIYVSMERNMKCAVGFCGHCQYGSHFICKDGPVFPYSEIEKLFNIYEI